MEAHKREWRLLLFAVLIFALAVRCAEAQTRAPLPSCWPLSLKAKLESAPQLQYVLFWACDSPKGVSHYALFFDWARAAEWVGQGALTKAAYDAAYGERSREMTAEERAYAYEGDTSLLARFGSFAMVRANASALSRPVYAPNADGTRNTVPVANARVAIKQRCDVSRRLINAASNGTNYYSVQGADNVATAAQDKLGDVFALCDRTDPLGVN